MKKLCGYKYKKLKGLIAKPEPCAFTKFFIAKITYAEMDKMLKRLATEFKDDMFHSNPKLRACGKPSPFMAQIIVSTLSVLAAENRKNAFDNFITLLNKYKFNYRSYLEDAKKLFKQLPQNIQSK